MIIVNTDELKKLQKGLTELPSVIPKVTMRAINYGLDKMKTETWRCIKAEYNIQQKRVYDALTLIKANESNLSGAEVATDTHSPLGYFKISPSAPHPAPTRPVISAAVRKGSSKPITGGFVATMSSGHTGVFERVPGEKMAGQNKEKIRELFTIGVSEMVGAQRVRDKIEQAGHDALFFEFGRLADMEMKKALDHKD
jgi:hypothetical protein